MMYYLTFAFVALLYGAAVVGSFTVQVAVIGAMVCLGAMLELIRYAMKPMDASLNRDLSLLLGVISGLMLGILFRGSYAVQVIVVGALLGLALIMWLIHKIWPAHEFGLDDHRSQVVEEAERFFQKK